MCVEFHKDAEREEIAALFDQLSIPFRWADAPTNRPRGAPFKPTNRATIIRPIDTDNPHAGLEGLEMRWWLIPPDHTGTIKESQAEQIRVNFKVEYVDTTKATRDAYLKRRCLVPITSFVEYDKPPGWTKGDPSRRWDISWPGRGIRFFAGVWNRSFPSDAPEGIDTFSFGTGTPGPDFSAPRDHGKGLHHRQARVFPPSDAMDWLRLDGPGKAMLQDPGGPGSFTFKMVSREAAEGAPS